MATDKDDKQTIKVTDRRIFTSDGDIREEFQEEIRPAEGDPLTHGRSETTPPPAEPQAPPSQVETSRQAPGEPEPQAQPDETGSREPGANPGTPFAMFVEQLVVQAYMSLGMLRSPYGEVPVDVTAAKQMIDILSMLQQKTAGNLTAAESDFLQTHLGELKLAWVRQSKSI